MANKSDEAIFIDNEKVIKYFDDNQKVSKRIKRAEYLNGNSPKIESVNKRKKIINQSLEAKITYGYIPKEMIHF